MNEDIWKHRVYQMVVSAWCLWENPEEKRKLVWEGKQLAQVISCYYSNWAGVEGAFRKKLRSWNAGLIGNPWLCFIWLWGWFYEATYGERKQLMPLVGRVAAVIPTFPWVGSFRLIGNSTGAESERSFLLTAGTFQLRASSAGQWHRSLSSDCFRLRCAALTKLNRPQCLEGCRSSVLPTELLWQDSAIGNSQLDGTLKWHTAGLLWRAQYIKTRSLQALGHSRPHAEDLYSIPCWLLSGPSPVSNSISQYSLALTVGPPSWVRLPCLCPGGHHPHCYSMFLLVEALTASFQNHND